MDTVEHREDRRVRRKRSPGWTSVVPPPAIWPIAAAFLASVFFLTGRIYRLSYLGHFHLEPSLFPDDLAARAAYAVTAWAQVFGLFNRATSGYWTSHMVLGILGPTLALLGFAFLLALWRTMISFIRARASREPAPSWLSRPSRAAGRWLLRVLRWLFPNEEAWGMVDRARRLIVGALAAYLIILVMGLLLVLVLRPFQLAGEDVAAGAAAARFGDRAVVRLPGDGKEVTYRLMECGPAYCALFADGHAVVVPMSELKRGESPAP